MSYVTPTQIASPSTSMLFRTRPAGQTLSGHLAVYLAAGVLLPCQLDLTAEICVGVTTGGAASGALCNVQTAGLMEEPSWLWDPSKPVWLGASGALVQVLPSSGVVCRIGMPIGPTTLRISPQFIASL